MVYQCEGDSSLMMTTLSFRWRRYLASRQSGAATGVKLARHRRPRDGYSRTPCVARSPGTITRPQAAHPDPVDRINPAHQEVWPLRWIQRSGQRSTTSSRACPKKQRTSTKNYGPIFKFNEAASLVIHCRSQDEVDRYWNHLSVGVDEKTHQCGWLKDRYGVSWQLVPTQLIELLNRPDPDKAGKAMSAMLQMKKIDLEALCNAVA
jgi:hypothetical protein